MTTAPNESTDTTPPPGVITIDPEDTAQIERLAYVISAALGGASVPVEKLQRAARRFVVSALRWW